MGYSVTSLLMNIIRKKAGGIGLALLLLLMLRGATGTMAQEDSLSVWLTGLNSKNFPEITARLAVSGTDGPVEGLTADNFDLLEDEQTTAVNPLTVQAETLKNLRLVVALDTSTTDLNLAEGKAALINMLGQLGPGDKAALLTFADNVNLEYNFTNNTTALQAAAGRLSPGGNRSALHQAVVDAAGMLDEFTEGRKAVVVITDNFDNTGSLTAEQVFSQLQQSGVPLYIFGVGQKVTGPHPLKTQAALSGGQFTGLTTPDQLSARLLDLEKMLRKGYRISFQSGLKADRLAHQLIINVTGPDGQPGQTSGRFVATPGKIIITPQNIAADQTVKGTVKLAAEILSPSPLDSVSYALDNQLLAQVSTAPYSFNWDTTATPPGNHTLTIQAVDQAGNEAQVSLNVEVAPPLQVSLSAPAGNIEVGQPAAVQVKIEAEAEVARLDLLLDDRLLESKTAPPFNFSLDSSQYPTGTYQITVRAEDAVGRTAQDSWDVNFVPGPPPPPGLLTRILQSQWLKSGTLVGAAVLAIAASLVLVILLLIILERTYQRRSRRRTRLEIINMGNVQSRYSLLGRDTQNELDFQFLLNGELLPDLPPASEAEPVGTAAQVISPVQTPAVEPDDSLWVDLQLRPHNPYQKATYPIEIISLAIDQPHAPKIKEQALVEIRGLFWGWRYLSFLLVLVMFGWLIWQIVSLTIGRLTTVDITSLLSLLW